MPRDYKILSNTETEMLVQWTDTGQEILYPIPRDTKGKALGSVDLDSFLERRYDTDVAPILSPARNNVAIENLVLSGEIRNAGPRN